MIVGTKFTPHWFHADAGTCCAVVGTNVATETCGQVKPAKLRNTVWEYWIWVESTTIVFGAVISCGGFTSKTGTGAPGWGAEGAIFKGASPSLKGGIRMLCCTVSIQNVAITWTALAFGPFPGPVPEAVADAGAPCKKAILAVPPPSSGVVGFVETLKTMVLVMVFPMLASRNTVFGSVKMACVMVPSAINLLRSCGSRGVLALDAVWLAKVIVSLGLPIKNGVISTAFMVGGPAMLVVGARAWALMVVPCGMDAIRTSDSPSTGSVVVAGMCIHSPGSKWMPEDVPSALPVAVLVTSLIACTVEDLGVSNPLFSKN
jgi:hypothetical protein